MKKILAVSILALGLTACTAREQQLVAAGAVGVLAGAVVANGVSESNHHAYYQHRPYYQQHPYYHPRPVRNPYVYHAPRRPQCYSTWDRTPYGLRERRVCRSW